MLGPASACQEEPPVSSQASRCEPDNELLLERDLKRGYRALWEHHPAQARAAFKAVLARAPGHPQAQAGLVAARRGVSVPPHLGSHRGGPLWIGGQPIWTDLDIHAIRYRFEERAQESALAHELGLCPSPPAPPPTLPRQPPGGGPLPTDDPVPAVQAIDLVVLRDARALNTRAAFLHMLAQGRSVHLSIDWDGTIYQHLDLARAATQPDLNALSGVSARSVVVALVNPIDPASPPTPLGDDAQDRRTREVVSGLSQGRPVRRWSYTEAQRRSLIRLVTALRTALPHIPARLPEDDDGEVPNAALPPATRQGIQGVVGALHLTAEATDPGPDLGWARLRQALHP